MAKAEALKRTVALAPGFEDKIRDARYLVGEDRFFVTFDSGKEYSFARSPLETDDGTDVVSVKVDSKRFFFVVTQSSGNKYEIPWDRVLYEAEASYPYFRRRAARVESSRNAGGEIGKLRKARGMTQAELARAAKILRPNLARIEAGKHRPTLDTLEKLAAALKVPVADLIAGK
ncbi:MAG: helix-turn-helix domain-containing protein [Candidatus Binatia bacterium]